METFLEWLNQRDPEYLFESAFAEQNSELIEETFGRRMGRRPLFAPRPSRQVVTRRQSYAPVNRSYTQGRTQANRTIPNMDPVTGKVLPDDVSPLTVNQADDRREPQQLDLVAFMGSNVSNLEKQNRVKKFIADELQGDLKNANEDEISAIASGINDGVLDRNLIPQELASQLINIVSMPSVKEELEKLTLSPHQSQIRNLINRADRAAQQFPPR